jgi:hypothetical protein
MRSTEKEDCHIAYSPCVFVYLAIAKIRLVLTAYKVQCMDFHILKSKKVTTPDIAEKSLAKGFTI